MQAITLNTGFRCWNFLGSIPCYVFQSPKIHGSYFKSLETLAKKKGRLDEKQAAEFPGTLDYNCSVLPFQDTSGLSHFVQPSVLIWEIV